MSSRSSGSNSDGDARADNSDSTSIVVTNILHLKRLLYVITYESSDSG